MMQPTLAPTCTATLQTNAKSRVFHARITNIVSTIGKKTVPAGISITKVNMCVSGKVLRFPVVVELSGVFATPIMSTHGPIGIVFNDNRISGAPLDPARQEMVAVYCSLLGNIIERKRAEEALREGEERFRAAAEGNLDSFYILQSVRNKQGKITDFRFIYTNQRGATLIGKPDTEIIGQNLCELLPLNRSRGFFDKYAHVVSTRQPLEEEFQPQSAGVSAGWVHYQGNSAGRRRSDFGKRHHRS
jgi:PAS domain-containing protein